MRGIDLDPARTGVLFAVAAPRAGRLKFVVNAVSQQLSVCLCASPAAVGLSEHGFGCVRSPAGTMLRLSCNSATKARVPMLNVIWHLDSMLLCNVHINGMTFNHDIILNILVSKVCKYDS